MIFRTKHIKLYAIEYQHLPTVHTYPSIGKYFESKNLASVIIYHFGRPRRHR